MKKMVSGMWRSGVAFLLALCMVASCVPFSAFAKEVSDINDDGVINYVSLGASNTNGFGLMGYLPDELYGDPVNKFNGSVYGYQMEPEKAYPTLVKDAIETMTGKTVELDQLAISSMRAEELHVLLDNEYYGDKYTEWRFTSGQNWFNMAHEDGLDGLRAEYQNYVRNADVITVDIGANNFGVYASNRIFNNMFDADFTRFDEGTQRDIAKVKEKISSLLMELDSDMLTPELSGMVDHIVDAMTYALVGFCVNFDASMDRIYELNPDAIVVVVNIQNLMHGLKATLPGLDEPFAFGEFYGAIVNMANAYISSVSPYADKYYYAYIGEDGQAEKFLKDIQEYTGNPADLRTAVTDCFDVYDNDMYLKTQTLQAWLTKYISVVSIVDNKYSPYELADLKKFSKAVYEKDILVAGVPLDDFLAAGETGALADINLVYQAAYDEYKAMLLTGYNTAATFMQLGAKSEVMDLAAAAANFSTVGKNVLGTFFTWLVYGLQNPGFDVTQAPALPYFKDPSIMCPSYEEVINDPTYMAIITLGVRSDLGNSFFSHPNENGHVQIKDAIINAIEDDITGKDYTSNELKDLAIEIAKDIWNQWVKAGYVGDVEKTIDKLVDRVEARYGTYEKLLLTLNTEMEELVATKDALETELVALKAALAEKKAELAAVIAKQEISGVTAPDINIEIDPDLGNNTQTTVPDNDCTVGGDSVKAELEKAIADLEHAIAVLEALISDISADIADMAKLAAELAEAVKALGKTAKEITAAAKDLMEAMAAVKEVMTNESAYATAEQFKKAFEAAKVSAMEALDALKVASVIADELMVDVEYMLDVIIADGEALYEKIKADLPKVIENAPMEVKIALATALMIAEEKGWDKEWAEGKIREELDKIKAEYEPEIEKAMLELEALKAKIELEVAAKYAVVEAQLKAEAAAKIAALEAKKAALKAELLALKAQLDAAEGAVRDTLQAQIDRVNGDLAAIDADILHINEHLKASLEIAYNEIVNEVNALYADAIAKLEKLIADLNAQLEAAIGKSLDELIALGFEGLKALKNELIALGKAGITALVNKLVELHEQMLYNATHGEVLAGLKLNYVALGDGTNDFAAVLADLLAGKTPANINLVNAAKPGNTAASVAANLPAEVAGAHLITLGFSQTELIGTALNAFLNGEELNWTELVGADVAPYVAVALEYAYGEIDAMDLDETTATMVKAIAEAYAYGVADYAINLPVLIKNIREVNATAEIVIVGVHNPLENLAIELPLYGKIDLSAYTEIFDYMVDAVYGYGAALSVIAKDVIYVDAREVEIENDNLGFEEIDALLKGDISALYPSANGDAYIAEQIANALTIKMLGDANGDGVVDSYDATLIARYDVGLIDANGLNLAVCDVNEDGVVDSYDATLVARYDVGLLGA